MLTTENNMTYFVDYTYNTTGSNFGAQYGFMRINATSKADAITKAKKQAPSNAKGFKATPV